MSKHLTVSIHEVVCGHSTEMQVTLCPACNEPFVEFVPTNPGDHYCQVLTSSFCKECFNPKTYETLPIDEMSNWEEINAYRKTKGFPTYFESCKILEEKFKQQEIMATARMLTSQITGHRLVALDTEAEEHKWGNASLSEKEAATMAWVYNAGPEPIDEDYYSPHKDLMVTQYKELGESHY